MAGAYSLLGPIGNWIRDFFQSRRECQSATLDLAMSLEAFSQECARAIEDSANERAQTEDCHPDCEDRISLVAIPRYMIPSDIKWRFVSPKVEADVKEYVEEVATAHRRQDGVWFWADSVHSWMWEMERECANLGARAWRLASTLRTEAKLKLRSRNTIEQDVMGAFADCLRRYDQRQHRIDVSNAKLADELGRMFSPTDPSS